MKTNIARIRTTAAAGSATALLTHEGAPAARIDAVQQLRRSVMSCMLWEDEFYESGTAIADRIHEHVAEVLRLPNGADIVGNIAFEARTKFKLRHAPLWLVIALIRAQTTAARAVVAGAIATVVQRPDELAELIAMYWKAGKRPLTAQMKLGLAAAFAKFDRYSLSKYANRDGQVKMRDVLFLVHAKPETDEQTVLWRELAENELKAPDTWEASLSAGKDKRATFTRLIQENQLGALALLRNLRGMIESAVDMSVIRGALATMKTERILPFRFITAARYAPTLEPELEAAMFRCLAGQPKLLGKTALVIDTSGSMQSKVSGKSEISRQDAAAALGMLLREVCDDVLVIGYGDRAGIIPPRRGFALRDAIGNGKFGHSTNTQAAVILAAQQGYDRCIVITDEQSYSAVSNPLIGTKGYFVNVASARNGIGYGDWIHADGWSESILDFIQQYEAEACA